MPALVILLSVRSRYNVELLVVRRTGNRMCDALTCEKREPDKRIVYFCVESKTRLDRPNALPIDLIPACEVYRSVI